MKRTNRIRLTESQLHKVIKESVDKVLKENPADFGTAYDRRGKEIHEGDIVVWYDPETNNKEKYEVYGQPTEDMVKLWSEYGECEALPEECLVIKRK